MTSPPDASPYLRAATAGLRHHTRALTNGTPPVHRTADRAHLDTVHAHLTALHQLLDRLTELTRPPHPTAGRHLAAAHTLVWQAAAEVHNAFHTLPATAGGNGSDCEPKALPQGPPFLTICHRHLATGHAVRRKTTPADHNAPAS
ncbi:DUF6238 family protein [Streptomyces amakusaensis]|uniref:DUF6238 family protein n=1 Tax=Streptomyces amakusaensis TaxID=67271 RepID=A0ABW0AM57_9ACTN